MCFCNLDLQSIGVHTHSTALIVLIENDYALPFKIVIHIYLGSNRPAIEIS